MSYSYETIGFSMFENDTNNDVLLYSVMILNDGLWRRYDFIDDNEKSRILTDSETMAFYFYI